MLSQPEKAALTVNEFCTRFGVGRSYFYQEVRAGRLKVRKAGRRSLVLIKDADAWVQSLPQVEALGEEAA